jgi:hypothetical protein
MAGFYVSQMGMGLYFEDRLGYVRDLETGQEIDDFPENARQICNQETIEKLIADYADDYEEIRQWWQTKPGFYEGQVKDYSKDQEWDSVFFVDDCRRCWILIMETNVSWEQAIEIDALPKEATRVRFPSMAYYLLLERFLPKERDNV